MRQDRAPAFARTISWRPLLDGSLGDRAREAIAGIGEALPQPSTETEPTLAGGSAGWALYWAYAGSGQPTERCLAHAIDGMASVPIPGLYPGFLGIAWAAAHLRHQVEAVLAPGAFDDVDEVLGELVQHSPRDQGFDLITGLVGMGLYALERLPLPGAVSMLERVIDRLEETAKRFPAGIAWSTPGDALGRFDVGMAHGAPGVIAFLGMVDCAGIARKKVRALAELAIGWLLSHKMADGSRSHFPSKVENGVEAAPTRTAWCYGDPGIAAALSLAGRSMENIEWEREGLALAHAVARRLPSRTGVQDAGLCHGAAGIAHVLNRLAQTSGDGDLAQASIAWFERVLDMRSPGGDQGGFDAVTVDSLGHRIRRPEPGFVTGSAGIGLALLAAVSDVEPAWDRVLLLSMP